MSGNHRADSDTPRRPRTDWGRVADGVGLAGLGIFFLVATVRGLPDGFWMEALSFWPVLLVSAGIRIVFEKTPLAAGMILGPVVVVSTLFWLAWGDPPQIRPPGEWHALSADRPPGAERARIDVELAGVRVDLEARSLGPGLLAEGRAASRESTPRLEVDARDDGKAELRLEGREGGFLMIGTRREVWDLGITDTLPLELELNGVFLRGDLDLRRGWVAGAETNGAFSAWSVRLPPPSEPVTIRFRGAFSTFDVTVPEGTPVRYHGPGFPIVWGSRGPARDGIGEKTPGYEVILEGAFSVVNIEEGPAPEGGWPPARPPLEDPDEEREASGDPEAAKEERSASESPEAAPRPPAEAEPGSSGSAPDPPAEDPAG